jgi:ProP effector
MRRAGGQQVSSPRRRHELAAQTLAILAERFPEVFALKGRRRPLKIGIDRDLASALTDLSRASIKDALRLYAGSPGYRRVLVDGATRVDLAGAPAGVVSAEVAATASARASQRRAIPRASAAVPAAPPQ